MQALLVIVAAGLLMYAGYARGRAAGYDDGRRADEIGAPRPPSLAETIVPALLGLGALGAALALQGREGLRLPTPARLDELAGRAEKAAIDRAERSAEATKEPRTEK
jgi:hypothetical protein